MSSHAVSQAVHGLIFPRVFSRSDVHPFDEIEWTKRDAVIGSATGSGAAFRQDNVEAPASWSQTATNIVASKYFHGQQGTEQRETSVRQVITRVVDAITGWGQLQGYFATDQDAAVFSGELCFLLVNQYASFNSPVWFNVGCDLYEPESPTVAWNWDRDKQTVVRDRVGYRRPQVSACFINAISDSMVAIAELDRVEKMLFKGGSGSGTNFSPLRGSMELLAGGGTASGPLSFIKASDSSAGVIKSGGKTRRAAKMAILNADHPDIEAFIACKVREEDKAHALIAAGFDGSGPDSEVYQTIAYQNANHSVRVTDEFMERATAEDDNAWALKAVVDGRTIKTVSAKQLLREIAEATWRCGDPGMQFDTTMNRWHTVPASGRQNATNPCSEFSFLDDSSCNLASLNLLRFYDPASRRFDVERFRAAVRVMVMAQDILVDSASYPTEKIAATSHDYRPLGLGYANLGALLMANGLPYDSDAGRAYAACITSLMTGEAYAMSALIAGAMPALRPATELLTSLADATATTWSGACPGFFHNAEPFMAVVKKHEEAAINIPVMPKEVPNDLRTAAEDVWASALCLGKEHGFRNAQVTVLAPTGTIGFMMDCDTTGIEPAIALVSFKKLVGGGSMKLVNRTVKDALAALGYNTDTTEAAVAYIEANGTVEGCADVKQSDYAVFDCALRAQQGTRSISPRGHIAMMAAVQPFLSGAISKTVNMPSDASVDDILAAYIAAWRSGLKAIAIYRDGSKTAQIITTKSTQKEETTVATAATPLEQTPVLNGPPKATRNRLPDDRQAVTHKFVIANYEGFLTVGLYENGQPGEMFIRMAKQGSTIAGLMDTIATAVSIGLQHGVPLQSFVDKFGHMRFEPSGWTRCEDVGYAKSIVDYIFRWMEARFLKPKQNALFPEVAVVPAATPVPPTAAVVTAAADLAAFAEVGDAPSCPTCGNIMRKVGACFCCESCGSSTGACG